MGLFSWIIPGRFGDLQATKLHVLKDLSSGGDAAMPNSWPQFRLIVMRPVQRGRGTWYVEPVFPPEATTKEMVPVETNCILEEIYVWDPGDANPSATLDPARTKTFQSALIEPFRLEVPPEQRSILRLQQALEELKQKLGSNESDWGPSGQEAPQEVAGEGNSLEANVLIALQTHLRWICETFQSIPGISILIQ